jgi:hypothetical protein
VSGGQNPEVSYLQTIRRRLQILARVVLPRPVSNVAPTCLTTMFHFFVGLSDEKEIRALIRLIHMAILEQATLNVLHDLGEKKGPSHLERLAAIENIHDGNGFICKRVTVSRYRGSRGSLLFLLKGDIIGVS